MVVMTILCLAEEQTILVSRSSSPWEEEGGVGSGELARLVRLPQCMIAEGWISTLTPLGCYRRRERERGEGERERERESST